jgi:hypothetical protein
MDDDMGKVPVGCPDLARWIHVAAGTENPEMSIKLSEHAANCAACAAQLRESIRVVADAEDPIEDRFVAQLQSSQDAWSRAMVQRLSRDPELSRAGTWTRGPLWRRYALGLAAAALIAVGLTSFLILRSHQPSQRSEQIQVSPPASSPGARTPANPAPAPQALVASIVLEPGTTRGLENRPSLQLTTAIHSAAVTLLFREPPPRSAIAAAPGLQRSRSLGQGLTNNKPRYQTPASWSHNSGERPTGWRLSYCCGRCNGSGRAARL